MHHLAFPVTIAASTRPAGRLIALGTLFACLSAPAAAATVSGGSATWAFANGLFTGTSPLSFSSFANSGAEAGSTLTAVTVTFTVDSFSILLEATASLIGANAIGFFGAGTLGVSSGAYGLNLAPVQLSTPGYTHFLLPGQTTLGTATLASVPLVETQSLLGSNAQAFASGPVNLSIFATNGVSGYVSPLDSYAVTGSASGKLSIEYVFTAPPPPPPAPPPSAGSLPEPSSLALVSTLFAALAGVHRGRAQPRRAVLP